MLVLGLYWCVGAEIDLDHLSHDRFAIEELTNADRAFLAVEGNDDAAE